MTRRKLPWYAALCACALAAACVAAAQASGERAAAPGAVRTTVSDPERDYELRGLALSPDGAAADLVIAAHPKGRPDEAGPLVWVSLDDAGKASPRPEPLRALATADAAALKPDPSAGSLLGTLDGKTTLLLPSTDGRIRSLRFGGADGRAALAPFGPDARPPTVSRVLTKGANRLVLVGSVGAMPLVAELNADGKTAADYSPREEGMTAVGAALEPAGVAVVLGERGISDAAVIWLGRVSARGEILAKTVFPGRPYDIARAADGTLLVVFARPGVNGSEILIKGFAPDLSERWTRTLMVGQRAAVQFRAAAVPSGGFVIAGVKDRGLWLSQVRMDGVEVWTEAHEPAKTPDLEMVFNVELASAQDVFVAAYTAFVVADREQRQVVRTIKFRAG